MLKIKIICIGKIKEKYLTDAISEYNKRLKSMCKLEIIELSEHRLPENYSDIDIKTCINKEGVDIIKKIGAKDYIIPLCIEGENISSESLAMNFIKLANSYSTITFIIGGSYGLSDEVKKLAHFKLSMSKMTFAHQFARVMILEQIYRAFSINIGTKYHK